MTQNSVRAELFLGLPKEEALTFRYLAGADIAVQQANPWLPKKGSAHPHLNLKLNIISTRTEKTGHLTHWRDTFQDAMPHKEKRRHF